jgi:hypothetical protein
MRLAAPGRRAEAPAPRWRRRTASAASGAVPDLPFVAGGVHKAPCGRTRRGDRRGPSPPSPITANCLNLNQKKCKFLYDQDIGTGRRTWWRGWCAKHGPAGEPTPASTSATVCGCCERYFPVLRFFQECLLYWSTSLLTLRSVRCEGPTIVNRKVPLEGCFRAEACLSQASYTRRRAVSGILDRRRSHPPPQGGPEYGPAWAPQ